MGNGQSVTYSSNDALYSKTSPNPILHGARQSGIMVFDAPNGVIKEDLTKIGTMYRLVCGDVFGKPVIGEQRWNSTFDENNPDQMPYVPGLKVPRIEGKP